MKKFMDSIVDMDSPFSFCGGGGLADEELIGSTYFQEGTGIVVAPVITNYDISGDGDGWDEITVFLSATAVAAAFFPGPSQVVSKLAAGGAVITGAID
jgi:hypothetical protein|tara:strand:+ start:34079 stop:34372 length:294 start_codon:yes stop_codon:yes gene_type:complete